MGFGPIAHRLHTTLILPLIMAGSLASLSCGGGQQTTASGPFDILIQNARIVDGAGNPWYRGDVGIVGDRIAAVGRLAGAEASRSGHILWAGKGPPPTNEPIKQTG